jgi:hypothetical protein
LSQCTQSEPNSYMQKNSLLGKAINHLTAASPSVTDEVNGNNHFKDVEERHGIW